MGEGIAGEERAAQLRRYRAKRDFALTPEPSAGGAAATGASRFVIHEHSARRLHWDLRLERDGVLVSWAIPKGLPETPRDNRFAAATEDHPLEYLDFEGEIPRGQYGAGTITIWDRGTFDCLKWEPHKVEVALHGRRLNARYALFAIDKREHPGDWMIHRMDPPEDPDREPMPARIVPMLARAGSLPADDDDRWAYEIKWDGVRAIAYSRPGELRVESRNLIDITERYPELGRLGRALSSHGAVLDGEIVALDGRGRPSFGALQERMQLRSAAQARRQARDTPVTYVIFDLLWLDGHSLMGLPYASRRELLEALSLNGESWRTPEHVVGHGRALLQAAVEQGLEGVVAKRLESAYEPGRRTRDWVKVKAVARQEFVIGGWLPGKGKRGQSIGALLLGVHEPDGSLRYVGRVGSGFSERELDRLSRALAPLERSDPPFAAGEEPPRGAVFCEPRLLAEVEFSEWTAGGSLRQPVYKGMRDDKPAAQVAREPQARAPGEPGAPAPLIVRERTPDSARASVDGHELRLSNLAKVLYPQSGFTKREVIDYYAAIAPALIGHLQGRALTLTRWPDGVDGKSFFQKHAPAHRPDWVRTVSVPGASTPKGTPPAGAHPEGHRQAGKPIDYILAQDLPTIVWLANLAAIELHVPLARAAASERPTALVFDLDPGAPATIVECCRVALRLHGMFENLGLHSYAKTSGSKGLQVYLPLNRDDVTFAHTKPFAKAVAELLEGADGDLVVSRMTKARRTGRVLIDWSQNDAKKTTVCAYSLRAAERPTVSTPLEWGEVSAALDAGDPGGLAFEARQVLERVRERGDLFAPVLSLVQDLPSS